MTNHFEFKIRIIKTNIINMNLYEANYKIIERFLFFEIMHFIIQDKYSYPWKRGYQYSYMMLSKFLSQRNSPTLQSNCPHSQSG